MRKKVVLAGGTGFVGQYFEKRFTELDYDVKIISRQSPHISWENEQEIIAALENADMLINLAGKSVDCRYNARNKREILKSRIETTNALGNALLACNNPPSVWFNASTATIYRHAEDKPMGEETGEIGSGFSVYVAKEWEGAFFAFDLPHTRQIALRIAIVLGDHGGVMGPLENLVKYGLGGAQGSGNQMFSWLHIEDLFNIVQFLESRDDLSGVFNCSSPYPITNRDLMKHLRKSMHAKVGLPSPKWLLEMGARFINTETELVLKSRWVIPERLEREGFTFKYEKIESALEQIIKSK